MNKNKILFIILIFTAFILLFFNFFSNRKSYNSISINEEKWNQILSSKTENTNLILGELKFNDYPIIVDEENDILYYSLINDSTSKYSPTVSFNSFDKKMKIAVLDDEITQEKVEAKHPFQVMIYNDKEYHIYQLICTNFPTINICYDAKSPKKKNIPMKMFLFNNLSNTAHRIMVSDGRFGIIDDDNNREYIFDLFAMSPGRNERENKISIFNMEPQSKYRLTSFDSENEEGSTLAEKNEVQKHPVELFINNEYIGLYLLENNM